MPDGALPADALGTGPTRLPARGTLLGFDFGLARIGVACAELETAHSSPLTTIAAEAGKERFAAIAALIDEWRPVALVVGIPTHLDGSEHELTQRCRRFAHQLQGRFGLPVHTSDERLSSHAADSALAEAGLRRWQQRKPVLDAAAAAIILQTFVDTCRHEPA